LGGGAPETLRLRLRVRCGTFGKREITRATTAKIVHLPIRCVTMLTVLVRPGFIFASRT
jgi:hypothetical protein